MRWKIIVGVVIVLLAAGGYVGNLVFRDARQYPLAKGASATIGGIDSMLLEESSSKNLVFPNLSAGDQIKVIDDPARDPTDRMRKVSVWVESGKCKGFTGKIARIWVRPNHWWQ